MGLAALPMVWGFGIAGMLSICLHLLFGADEHPLGTIKGQILFARLVTSELLPTTDLAQNALNLV